ncbi:hypothetical protein EJ08DRAFT_680164 [Tothia fuscella]|uniref:Uncharacterized protein n=1 Tax=Tothia fuscella TaxID=1048955 RepID=A0A9P4NPN7_9PEZI|nr:hypothetical protein EJ08DRAFT_680164 [Tothia fuscella]
MDSNPPKRRKTSPTTRIPVPNLQQNQSPTRASFLSPTRASLSRFNPTLLPVPKSPRARSTPQPSSLTPIPMPDPRSDLLARGQAALNFIMGGLSTSMGGTPTTPNVPSVITGEETDEQMAAMRAANAARRENERLESERRSLAPEVGRAVQGLADTAMEDTVEFLDEDDLPETPEAVRRQLDVEDTPPRGILFSSPSKRRKRKSPLKKNVLPQREEDASAAAEVVVSDSIKESQTQLKSQMKRLPPKDPETIVKEEEKARLEQELEELQKEIRRYERYIGDAEVSSETQGLSADLLTLLSPNPEEALLAAPPLSALLTSFLPFSIPIEAPATVLSKEVIPSHAPLKEADPLPLLSLFTPLTMTSTMNPPTKPHSTNESFQQIHNITLSGPASLLTCNLNLTIESDPTNPRNPTVQNLEIQQLSPWAKREVGEWFTAKAKEGDIAALGYALGRYWDISSTRAQCWSKCCKEFGSLVTCATEEEETGALNVQQLKQKKRGKRAQKGASVEEDVEMGEGEEDIAEVKMSKKELFKHLGRKVIVLKSDEVVLRIGWDVDFDWTGEVESSISAKAAFTSCWNEADEQGFLKKIPATFDMLVQERGVLSAIRIIAGLLFPT